MKRLEVTFLGSLVLLLLVSFISAQDVEEKKSDDNDSVKSIATVTKNLTRLEGFLPLYYNENSGKMYFEVNASKGEFLYQVSLSTGVGSNPIGLDRGKLSGTSIVSFEKVGDKLLLVEPNYSFRALSDNEAEKKAVRESFANSVLWGFKVVAAEGDKYLVDATNFLIRDAAGIGNTLTQTRQGNFSVDKSRSAFYMPLVKGFPKNTEVETLITMTTKGTTGRYLNQTVPTADAVSVRQRHSFVELPDGNYKPRKHDPRIGVFGISFFDYATDINEPLEKRWISRHRLKKKDAEAEVSEAVEPIIYYVDGGTPEKIRNALIEGASWWNQAFEKAGFKNAFQVKPLPVGADPMDIRYNVINWVHRSTRGWAYGSTVSDPRTGEIIRGVVTLDSQRARQDYLIASGLTPQYASQCNLSSTADIGYLLQADSTSDADALAVARIRQLSAHEVGHTLGFAHNFAASTYGRASVMDYPAPLINITNGKLDFSDAYAVGVGVYDKWVTDFAYREFPDEVDEEDALEQLLQEGIGAGYLFISDADTRPPGAAQPLSNLWDNGADSVKELANTLAVRKIGIANFGIENVSEGTALSELEAKFLPLYLHHRYQTTAATKKIGGVYYSYSVRKGVAANPKPTFEIVEPGAQREAISAVLETITPETLEIPERIIKLIPPRAFGQYSVRSETFPDRTSPVLDPMGIAEVAADMTIAGLLEPNRANRMINFNAQNSRYPSFEEVTDGLIATAWRLQKDANRAEIQRAVQVSVVSGMIDLAGDARASIHVRAIANSSLQKILKLLKTAKEDSFSKMLAEEIERFILRPAKERRDPERLGTPPGDPIGNDG